MVTFAQAQERAEQWVNGDVPGYQHREVRVREFELGFVVWAEDREGGARSDGGRQRLVIARDSGEATLWPGLPVGEVIRRYEEEYGIQDAPAVVPEQPQRIDLHQTSFLLSPPEWLQDAADKLGIPERRPSADEPAAPAASDAVPAAPAAPAAPSAPAAAGTPSAGSDWSAAGSSSGPGAANASQAGGSSSVGGSSWPEAGSSGADASRGGSVWPSAGSDSDDSAAADGAPSSRTGGTPWTDTSAAGGDEASVPLPATVFAPPISGRDDDDTPPPVVGADAPTALMSGGSQLPRTAVAPAVGEPQPGAADIADAATSKAQAPPRGVRAPRGGGSTTPPPPGAPGTPGARPGATPPPSGPGAPGAPAGGYLPTQLVPQTGPEGPQPPGVPGAPGVPLPPGPPGPPGSTPPPGGGVHHAATMFADPGQAGPGAPQPPGPPGVPGAPGVPLPPGPPGPPGSTPPPGGGVH
ncbi:hypothetical protein ABTX78_13440, partial [Streptomyces sp. NPDC096193]